MAGVMPDVSVTSLEGSIQHHAHYYIEDECTIFLVENQLFKVNHQLLVRESEFFRTLFELPPGDAGVEGRTDATAIPLPDVTVREFERLLDLLYNRNYSPSLKDWLAILSISTRFLCDKIRSRAINEILKYQSQVPVVEQAVLAQKYAVPQWQLRAYVRIVMRPEPLVPAEALQLGPDVATRISQTREQVEKNKQHRGLVPQVMGWNEKWGPGSEWSITETVKKVFWPEGMPKEMETE